MGTSAGFILGRISAIFCNVGPGLLGYGLGFSLAARANAKMPSMRQCWF